MLAGSEVRIVASIGFAIFPEHGEKIEVLLEKFADFAIWQAKKAGRQGFAVVDSDPAPRPKKGFLIE